MSVTGRASFPKRVCTESLAIGSPSIGRMSTRFPDGACKCPYPRSPRIAATPSAPTNHRLVRIIVFPPLAHFQATPPGTGYETLKLYGIGRRLGYSDFPRCRGALSGSRTANFEVFPVANALVNTPRPERGTTGSRLRPGRVPAALPGLNAMPVSAGARPAATGGLRRPSTARSKVRECRKFGSPQRPRYPARPSRDPGVQET